MQEQQEQAQEQVEPVIDAEAVVAAGEKEGVAKEPVVAEAAEVAPAFTPDFSYKFKGEVREIPELYRGLIKDEETQKSVRDMIERAEAMEFHKGKTQELEATLEEALPMAQTLQQFQGAFESARTPEDHLNLLNTIGYDNEMLKNVVRQILQVEQLPEEHRQLIEKNKAAALEKNQYMTQNQKLEAQYNEALTRITKSEIGIELGKAEHQSLIGAYEKAQGEGSFERLFLERGAYYTDLNGGNLVPPAEVMSRIAKEFAPFLTAQPAQGTAAPTQSAQVVTKPKTMPVVGSGNGSPAKTAINSLDDLKAKYKQLSGDVD